MHAKKIIIAIGSFLILNFFISGCSTTPVVEKLTIEELTENLIGRVNENEVGFFLPPGTRLQNVQVNGDELIFNFNRNFSYRPFRPDDIKPIKDTLRNFFGKDYTAYDVNVVTMDYKIEDLIPNFYRETSDFDKNRIFNIEDKPLKITRKISSPNSPALGLQDRNIVLWHSHGWYYSVDAGRWEWQRPRLFQTVEDLIPMSFTIPYLIPMLENAGAKVFVPRERDFQTNEVVVDNNTKSDIEKKSYIEVLGSDAEWTDSKPGFAYGSPPYELNYNPFDFGSNRQTLSSLEETAWVSWIPDIPETGRYAVYISYKASNQNVDDADYTVFHEGGATQFEVNQLIGGSTWIYLGTFKFKKGLHENRGVVLTNKSSQPGRIVSADAARFGGGMGLVIRNGGTSGRPKFVEGAKYFMQYAGMPDSLVYNLNENKNDYDDDYQSRPEYANYLFGAPFGPNKNRNTEGLGVPIDLTMAFHTDAGITSNDTTIGTLSIYSTYGFDTTEVFPNGISRIANRDLADVVQSQIVDDIRAKYDPAWNRRQLRNARYREAVSPNVPSLLMELLSHQNFLDMKFMLDPRFRFDVGRAMYKGMLKFLSVQNNKAYVVQPLPVTHFAIEQDKEGSVKLSWKPQIDPLEPTADAKQYIVYMRVGDGGFDNGRLVNEPVLKFNDLKVGITYSFKVTALNDGGESFPSEILTYCRMNDSKPVLIINAFDRICGPHAIETKSFSGFVNRLDNGVPDKFDLNFTGEQYDFDPASEFLTNDAPGHGASNGDFETKVIAGNSFDYPFTHGQSIKAAGYSFVSVSDEAVYDGFVDINKYKVIDIILGEEKQTPWQKSAADSVNGIPFKTFNSKFQSQLAAFTKYGGNLFVSGAYVGTDLFNWKELDSADVKFAQDILKLKLETNYAARTGEVFSVDSSIFKLHKFDFNTELNKYFYAVEAPDALSAINGSRIVLRYNENKFSAAVAYDGNYKSIVFGFPFETIKNQDTRNLLMKNILSFLNN